MTHSALPPERLCPFPPGASRGFYSLVPCEPGFLTWPVLGVSVGVMSTWHQAESRALRQSHLPLPTLQNRTLDAACHDSLPRELPESQKCTRNSLWSIAHSRSLLSGAAPRFQRRASAALAPPAGLPEPLRCICLVTLDQVLSCQDEVGSCTSE